MKIEALGWENPFADGVGQNVVSISESQWARLNRLGRLRNTYGSAGSAVTSGVTGTVGNSVQASIGCTIQYKHADVSCNQNAVLGIIIGTNVADLADGTGVAAYYTYRAAGIPFELDLEGFFAVAGVASGVAYVTGQAKPVADGTGWFTAHGWEMPTVGLEDTTL